MNAYRRDFDEIKYMSFQQRFNNSIKKVFDSEPVYNEKYLKIKSYQGKINTNFHNDKITKEGSQCICLLVILIDSVYRTGKNYYPQVFLEECKYGLKEKKMPEYITVDIEFLMMILRERILMKKIKRLAEYRKNSSKIKKIKTGRFFH